MASPKCVDRVIIQIGTKFKYDEAIEKDFRHFRMSGMSSFAISRFP